MHAKPDLRVVLEWTIAGSGSVIADVIQTDVDTHAVFVNQNSKSKFQFSARAVLWFISIIAVWFAAWNLSGKIAISEASSGRIQKGMTRQDVLNTLGRPHYLGIVSEGSWSYRVWDTLLPSGDALHVGFDENNRVNWVSF